jgi:hypothetical protein
LPPIGPAAEEPSAADAGNVWRIQKTTNATFDNARITILWFRAQSGRGYFARQQMPSQHHRLFQINSYDFIVPANTCRERTLQMSEHTRAIADI